ncbi:DUF6232 family protein [Streptomyces sp. NPDC085481]|uniref:DUF6232 family protein n=1 Tax=Streptomyces sp. NPDC085481 TaxID=3365727 RepID=UPI0037CDFB76
MDDRTRAGAQPSEPPQRPPAPPAATRDGVPLRISRRMLWVGTAAFPLHNITRVDTFMLKPDRWAAFLRFLKWFVLVAVVYVLFNVARGTASIGDSGAPAAVITVLVLLFVLVRELSRPSTPVLAIETASGSMMLVTLPDAEELRRLVGRIAYAIDNPEAEFSTFVQYVHNGDNNNGDKVVVLGGNNITGIRK